MPSEVISRRFCSRSATVPPYADILTELRENLQSEAGKPAIFEFAIYPNFNPIFTKSNKIRAILVIVHA